MKNTPPKWKYNDDINFSAPTRNVDTIFLHCSASDNPDHDDRSVMKTWHLARGFSDIGYHYFINKNGNIQEGRSIEKTPAAQKGHNTGSIAISCHGLKIDKFTDAQMHSVKALCKKIVGCYSKKIRIRGHREVSSKSCPVYDYRKVLGLDESGYLSSTSTANTPTPKTSIPIPDISKPPVASKTSLIQLFDNNSRVLALQNLLCLLGYPCSEDSAFGQDTLKAVENFQKSKQLQADGIVGPKTIDKMFSSANVILKNKDKGADVKVLQLLLAIHGKQITIDGIFGNGTKTALEAVQRAVRTKADGIFGPTSRSLMT